MMTHPHPNRVSSSLLAAVNLLQATDPRTSMPRASGARAPSLERSVKTVRGSRRPNRYVILVLVLLAILITPAVIFAWFQSQAASGRDRNRVGIWARKSNLRRGLGRPRADHPRPNNGKASSRMPTAFRAAGHPVERNEAHAAGAVAPSFFAADGSSGGNSALECFPSPLWKKTVDVSRYEFDCTAIEDMLNGEKTTIGKGTVGEVYTLEHNGRMLIVKTLRENFALRGDKSRAKGAHRREAVAFDAVNGHPNIVSMLGICGSTSVSEYFGTSLDQLVFSALEPLSISRIVAIALDAARGVQALHEVPGGAVVHFDLKPHRLMLDEDGRVKINDLKMCRFTEADASGTPCPFESPPSRPGPWTSPEHIAGEPLTEKVDIYSLGMVFYSMLAGRPPFEGEDDARGKILNGVHPPVDPSWSRDFVKIIQDMWRRDPSERPTAKQVVSRLETLLAGLLLVVV